MAHLYELREANTQRAAEWYGDLLQHYGPLDWSNALAGEAGEVANAVKKIRRLEIGVSHADQPEYGELIEKVGRELADVLIYADLLAGELGIDLWEALKAKFNEISEKNNLTVRL